MERADDAGVRGVKIGKELMGVAARALKAHIFTFAPLVLPLSEKLTYAAHATTGKVTPVFQCHCGPPFAGLEVLVLPPLDARGIAYRSSCLLLDTRIYT